MRVKLLMRPLITRRPSAVFDRRGPTARWSQELSFNYYSPRSQWPSNREYLQRSLLPYGKLVPANRVVITFGHVPPFCFVNNRLEQRRMIFPTNETHEPYVAAFLNFRRIRCRMKLWTVPGSKMFRFGAKESSADACIVTCSAGILNDLISLRSRLLFRRILRAFRYIFISSVGSFGGRELKRFSFVLLGFARFVLVEEFTCNRGGSRRFTYWHRSHLIWIPF